MMTLRIAMASLIFCGVSAALPAKALAFCGVIQESAKAETAKKAQKKARRAVKREVGKLRDAHGQKLQLSDSSVACLGGAAAVDASGNATYGNPSCTVTQPFCVNP